LEIIIEIGTQEQQAQIRQELAFLEGIVGHTNPPLNISQVVIPSDFDAKVNELQGTTTYESKRIVRAVAKIVDIGNSIVVVLSPLLYMENHDTQTRMVILLHEIMHVSNKRRFPTISSDSCQRQTYLSNLYILYDEYVADRLAFKIMDDLFQEKTKCWKAFVLNEATGFTSLINDPQHYNAIRSEIVSFRTHADVALYLKNIYPSFDNVALSIVHTISLADHDPHAIQITDLRESPFVNEKTMALMRFFKDKYQENAFNVNDGIGLIIDFMTNFGVKYEDTPQGTYCHVLNI
jgi:hypothetical protein